MNGGLYLNNQILEEATIDTMCSSYFTLVDREIGLGLFETTLSCANEDKTIWGHQGGGTNGYASEVQFCPDENIGVVYMSNSEDYALQVLKRLFEYGALIIIPESATNLTETSFIANWQVAPDAIEYYIDVATDWQFSNFVDGYENLSVGLDTSIEVTDLSSGTQYFYRITANNGVEMGPSSTSIATTTWFVNLDEKEAIYHLTISPNPAQKQLMITFTLQQQEDVVISLFATSGHKLEKEIMINAVSGINKFNLDISYLNNGVYFLKVNGDDWMITKKIVKL